MNPNVLIVVGVIGSILFGLFISMIRFRLAKLDITFVEFARRLILGGGYTSLSPQELDELRRSSQTKLQIIDLSIKQKSRLTPIPESVQKHFDDFLREVVVENRYSANEPIVLVCDTGQISRVAANILVEDQDFTRVYNLKGGIEKWAKRTKRSTWLMGCCGFRTHVKD